MDKCREAFERKGNIKIFVKLCVFDDSINEYSSDELHEYTLGFVNGAWWAFQEQQKRVDKLQAQLDAALKETQHALRYVEEDMRGNHEFLQMAMIRTFKSLAQALKGGEV